MPTLSINNSLVTLPSIHILLALAQAGRRVADRLVVQAASNLTGARAATLVSKVVEVWQAAVAPLTPDPGLAGTLAVLVTLQGDGAYSGVRFVFVVVFVTQIALKMIG